MTKIQNYGPQITPPTVRSKAATSSSGVDGDGDRAAEGIAGEAGGDSVKLTGQAQLMQQLEQAAAKAPAVDTARVAQVRQALDDGSYTVDAKSIASKLARMEWDLSQR
ncbi:flagellar biosynthesis anti-sigma factor FlgM [Sinimarinibacterium sp. CAU 1509]|uniref:flagellar biosynthesis anti-sigma factor FlgM n=1 Tax=Sinimarinibacterium sp. CAU 1509 TaxID=2562283 RepID=UPI0010AC0A40|nr:flagellar biosynthesis anti-sigma factor FlgM [Sinimarinibacterium sp. CAU 1509]TJY62881.1 flagellar biosynthesis anti-sigma factor FlgM [Sinimarinibacterium sp. CAU 1509]